MQYATACKRKDKKQKQKLHIYFRRLIISILITKQEANKQDWASAFFLVILMIQRIPFKMICGCWWARMQSQCALLMLSKPCEG